MQSIDVYKVAIWKKKFLLVITIIDDVICGQEVVEKSVLGHFLKQYYLRCHHAKKKSIRKTWTIFLHIHCAITVPNTGAVATPDNRKNIIIKTSAPFTDCISETNNTQIDRAKETHKLMPIYKLIEYSDNYSTISWSLWKYYRDEPSLDNDATADFPAYKNNSVSFKYKAKIPGATRSASTKYLKIGSR